MRRDIEIEGAVGKRLAAARHEAGLTGKQLGELSGYTLASISNAETGIRKPSIRFLVHVADALDVSLLWLATGEGEPHEDVEQRLREYASQLLRKLESRVEKRPAKPGGPRAQTIEVLRATLKTFIQISGIESRAAAEQQSIHA